MSWSSPTTPYSHWTFAVSRIHKAAYSHCSIKTVYLYYTPPHRIVAVMDQPILFLSCGEESRLLWPIFAKPDIPLATRQAATGSPFNDADPAPSRHGNRFILSFCTRKSVRQEQPLKRVSDQAGTRSERGNALVCSTLYIRHADTSNLRNHFRKDQGRSGMRFVRCYFVRSLGMYMHVIHQEGERGRLRQRGI